MKKAVAQRAGISLNTVIAIESGQAEVSVEAVVSVLHCLNFAEDISLIAQDDVFGRKLQDLKLKPKKRASKKQQLKIC